MEHDNKAYKKWQFPNKSNIIHYSSRFDISETTIATLKNIQTEYPQLLRIPVTQYPKVSYFHTSLLQNPRAPRLSVFPFIKSLTLSQRPPPSPAILQRPISPAAYSKQRKHFSLKRFVMRESLLRGSAAVSNPNRRRYKLLAVGTPFEDPRRDVSLIFLCPVRRGEEVTGRTKGVYVLVTANVTWPSFIPWPSPCEKKSITERDGGSDWRMSTCPEDTVLQTVSPTWPPYAEPRARAGETLSLDELISVSLICFTLSCAAWAKSRDSPPRDASLTSGWPFALFRSPSCVMQIGVDVARTEEIRLRWRENCVCAVIEAKGGVARAGHSRLIEFYDVNVNFHTRTIKEIVKGLILHFSR